MLVGGKDSSQLLLEALNVSSSRLDPQFVWWHSDGNPSFCELFLATGTDLREKPRLVQPTWRNKKI